MTAYAVARESPTRLGIVSVACDEAATTGVANQVADIITVAATASQPERQNARRGTFLKGSILQEGSVILLPTLQR